MVGIVFSDWALDAHASAREPQCAIQHLTFVPLRDELSLKRKLTRSLHNVTAAVASDILEITQGSKVSDILKLRSGLQSRAV